ncbi:MAG: phosphate acyltransferase PlsX [Oscillospiraceae bacterium]|jgi:glycerol-3-phosphate acyltransferase PlsX|nr:phosphate acyltransferase PlsX [Oscillospiraceae bacterium]
MNIVIDAFGGDNAPLEVIKGSLKAVKELNVDVTLVGDVDKIKACAKENNLDLNGLLYLQADSVIDIHEEPTEILKSQKGCSMAVGLQALYEDKGNAFVSAGSTGALLAGATFITKRIKGIKRAALAPLLPTSKGYMMLLDAGANTECKPQMLEQFAVMGSAYMEKVLNIRKPKVGLLNIGSENTKGREMEVEAYKLLENSSVNFMGNAEARELPKGEFDVIVTDGFTGNIALKLYEGMGSFFGHTLKHILTSGLKSKLAALMIMDGVKDFRKKMDYTEVGGAVLLGIEKPVIKAHGSSDAKAFFNAIRQAKNCIDGDIIGTIKNSLQ